MELINTASILYSTRRMYKVINIDCVNIVFWQRLPIFTNCYFTGAECYEKFNTLWTK